MIASARAAGCSAAVVAWSAVAALHAAAPGLGALVAVRLALGLAESPTFPGGVQTVQRGLPEGDRARGMSLLFVGMAVGGMLAPPIANGIAGRFGWRAAFLGTAALAAAWTPLWIAVTSRPRCAQSSTTRGETAGSTVDAGDGRHPAMMRGLIGLLAIVPASAFAMAWESKFYVRQFGLTQKGSPDYLVASALAYDVGAILFGDLAARRERRRRPRPLAAPGSRSRCGALLAAVGLAELAVAPSAHAALACFLAERRRPRSGRHPLQHRHARTRPSPRRVDGRGRHRVRAVARRDRDQSAARPRRPALRIQPGARRPRRVDPPRHHRVAALADALGIALARLRELTPPAPRGDSILEHTPGAARSVSERRGLVVAESLQIKAIRCWLIGCTTPMHEDRNHLGDGRTRCAAHGMRDGLEPMLSRVRVRAAVRRVPADRRRRSDGGAPPTPATPARRRRRRGAAEGGAGLGNSCNGSGDCAGKASYCLKDPTAAPTDPGHLLDPHVHRRRLRRAATRAATARRRRTPT